MVYWLDIIGDTALADSVMECAEPPAGMCIFMFMYIAAYTLSETSYQMYTLMVEVEMIQSNEDNMI